MKRLISVSVSLIILAILYSQIDLAGLAAIFQNCDRQWMVISLGMVIPITMITAWRLQQLMPQQRRLGWAEANRLILAASVLNMILPSKMGDIAKAYFMQQRGHLSGSLSLSLVVFEKTCDLLSLLLWCILGLIVYPSKDPFFWIMTVTVFLGWMFGLSLLGFRRLADTFFSQIQNIAPKKLESKIEMLQVSWGEMHDYFWSDKAQLLKVSITSILIWFLHLLQIWLFILSLNAETPFIASLALSPLAILAGLLPLTFAGVGTRDAALVILYQPYFNATTAAALGLLCTSRYFLPAVGGIPFISRYLVVVNHLRKSK